MPKVKQRGFVMTGGGAKGLYEAGVINAFHISGVEFDIVTGSSIGAINSAFFSEYLYFKRQLPEEVRSDPMRAVAAMDERVRAYHHAWLQMPDKKLIDDSDEGPIGQIKNDLQHFDLSLPFVASLAWWWTDPHRGLPPVASIGDATRLGVELIEHIGGTGKFLDLLRHDSKTFFTSAIRSYLARFNIEHALVPPDQDHKLKDIFTMEISPLRLEHLTGDVSAPDDPHVPVNLYRLVDPQRTLRDFDSQGITMRCTRTNYRSGRLEISAYVTPLQFVRFMQKHAWRVGSSDLEKVPLASIRTLVPGNPNAVHAALCSGRFPGVFAPFPLDKIYPADDPENTLLYDLLTDWLESPTAREALKQAYLSEHPGADQAWQKLAESWSDPGLRQFFPKAGDIYVDGGTVDNTPSNSAVDTIRELTDADPHTSRRDVELELFVIFLDTEPRMDQQDIGDPSAYDVVERTLAIQSAAKSSSDANTVDVINTFGDRGEALGLALLSVVEHLLKNKDSLSAAEKSKLEQDLFAQARLWDSGGQFGTQPEGILERIQTWADTMMDRKLPIQVKTVKIFPEEMPLDTLQFTERLGYRKENAIQMITMGCANTLWALRLLLEALSASNALDVQDTRSLGMVRRWMKLNLPAENAGAWPSKTADQDAQRGQWACQRTECVYFSQHCKHGAALKHGRSM